MAPKNLKTLFTFKSSNNKHGHQLQNADVTCQFPNPDQKLYANHLVIRVVFLEQATYFHKKI